MGMNSVSEFYRDFEWFVLSIETIDDVVAILPEDAEIKAFLEDTANLGVNNAYGVSHSHIGAIGLADPHGLGEDTCSASSA